MAALPGQTGGMAQPPRTFWNLSNHPIALSWAATQCEAARAWDGLRLEPRDFPFPPVDPAADAQEVLVQGEAALEALIGAGARAGEPVLVMGEFTLVFQMVKGLLRRGLVPVTATTHREATQELLADGSVGMVHRFRFMRFRRYEPGAEDRGRRQGDEG